MFSKWQMWSLRSLTERYTQDVGLKSEKLTKSWMKLGGKARAYHIFVGDNGENLKPEELLI